MRLTTTHLKIITAVMMVICLVMLLGWPMLLGDRPGPTAPRVENKAFAVKFVSYISIMVFCLLVAAVTSIGVLRRTAAEYRAQQIDNMRDLIEATLQDRKAANDAKVD
jgi:MFS superfamily sulfate permease-like transporter